MEYLEPHHCLKMEQTWWFCFYSKLSPYDPYISAETTLLAYFPPPSPALYCFHGEFTMKINIKRIFNPDWVSSHSNKAYFMAREFLHCFLHKAFTIFAINPIIQNQLASLNNRTAN